MDQKKAKILIFLPQLAVGGAELHAMDLFHFLKASGYPVRLLVFGGCMAPELAASLSPEEVVYLSLSGMKELRGWFKLRRVLRLLQPQLIISINQGPLIFSVLQRLMGATRARLACIFHTTELQAPERKQQGLFKWAAGFTDLLVYVSTSQQHLWQSRGIQARREVVIHNGIAIEKFTASAKSRAEMRDKLGLQQGDVLAGIVANFRPEKNHVELVRALAKIKPQGSHIHVLAVGQGETLNEVQDLAKTLNVADRFHFVGQQADVVPWLSACDLGLLCSTIETFPISALEFLASGLPMLATEVGGMGEIITDGENGLLYPSGDVDALANRLLQVEDTKLRERLASRAKASVAKFSLDAMRQHYIDEIEKLLGATA